MRGLRVAVLAVAMTTVTATLGSIPAGAGDEELDPRPVIFVHGFTGSGAQFETQAKRFTSNGYPAERIATLDYDSSFGVETTEEVFVRLDQLVADLLDDSDADQVDLLGHSLGTRLMQEYLRSSPERAAAVAHYVNIDGFPSADLPGGVPTLAIWGQGNSDVEVGGGTNLYLDNQTHVQTVSSSQSFRAIYEFFNDEKPESAKIASEDDVELAGRAVLFPSNVGVEAGELEIYEVDPDSGERIDEEPDATFPLESDGAWGPFDAEGDKRYEFAIVREGAETHHLYFEPFRRSDYWIRLLTSPIEGGINALLTPSEDSSGLVIVRYKEWWGDQGDANDVLEINGENVITDTNSPIDKRSIGVFVFDEEPDGASDIATPIAQLAALPFLTGVDLFMPAAEPPDGTIEIVSTPRGGGGKVATMNVPNWVSATDRMSVHFNDHLQGLTRPGS